MLVSLLLTLSTKSIAKENLDLTDPGVEEFVAEKLVDLKVCQQSLTTTTQAYNSCADKHSNGPAFWQTPTFVIGGFVITVSATAALMCLTHVMGACK